MNSKILLISLFTVVACSNKETNQSIYPHSPNVSRPDGNPIDSLTQFFPFELKFNNAIVQAIDTFKQKWYSRELVLAKELVLSNYYLGHKIYRFTWLRAFHPPVFISIHQDREQVWLESKTLDRLPLAIPLKYIIFSLPSLSKEDSIKNMKFQLKAKKEYDSIDEYRRHPIVLSKPIRKISMDEWNHFERLLNNCSFWKMNPTQSWKERGLDGSDWIIEAHQENKYWFVDRWSPRDNYKDCGKYLIELSGLKEEIY